MIVETGAQGAQGQALDLPGVVGPSSLREVLAVLAVQEVADYERRRAAALLDTLLDPPGIAAGLSAGAVRAGARRLPAGPSPSDAVDRVMEAFADGLVLAFLDGVPIEDVDAELVVVEESRLRLVRLVALRGG